MSNSRFEHRDLKNQAAIDNQAKLRKAFHGLDRILCTLEPSNKRYLAIARTHLETSALFADKMITHAGDK